jgi:hypothetical protein
MHLKKWIFAGFISDWAEMKEWDGQILRIKAHPVQCFRFCAFVMGLRTTRGRKVENPTK